MRKYCSRSVAAQPICRGIIGVAGATICGNAQSAVGGGSINGTADSVHITYRVAS
ncbi:MAG: hypothetical protein H6577_24665 [Lewinellaceae bacterium]|nr:hypothetical protein [Lewinellaceae bacterium]